LSTIVSTPGAAAADDYAGQKYSDVMSKLGDSDLTGVIATRSGHGDQARADGGASQWSILSTSWTNRRKRIWQDPGLGRHECYESASHLLYARISDGRQPAHGAVHVEGLTAPCHAPA
jgi:hypothetical protein